MGIRGGTANAFRPMPKLRENPIRSPKGVTNSSRNLSKLGRATDHFPRHISGPLVNAGLPDLARRGYPMVADRSLTGR